MGQAEAGDVCGGKADIRSAGSEEEEVNKTDTGKASTKPSMELPDEICAGFLTRSADGLHICATGN